MKALLKRFLHSNRAVIIVWCLVIPWASAKINFSSSFSNNYYVFKYSYIHAVSGVSLYGFHPGEHDDKNNYGPLFSILFAPFAVLPDWAGLMLWVSTLVLLLLFAIRQLPLDDVQKNGILLISVNELLTSAFHVQFNIVIAAVIVLTFAYILKKKDVIAPLPILIGGFVKLYSFAGFAFFFLVRNKLKFILGCVIWSVVLFLLPMILSSPQYVINAYTEWYNFLIIKNTESAALANFQDISIVGFVRRALGDRLIPGLPFLAAGFILFALPYLRISHYSKPAYQYLLLASSLMFPVIFSSASEGATYIIVFVGIGIWFMIQPRPYSKVVVTLLVLSILFASLNSTDIYPREFRIFLREHSVKAVPCFLVWLRIIYEMCTSDFSNYRIGREADKPVEIQS